jgi:hypothetical protein
VAEGARLESVFTLTGNVGSNPTLSAACSTPRSKINEMRCFPSVYAASMRFTFCAYRHVLPPSPRSCAFFF